MCVMKVMSYGVPFVEERHIFVRQCPEGQKNVNGHCRQVFQRRWSLDGKTKMENIGALLCVRCLLINKNIEM